MRVGSAAGLVCCGVAVACVSQAPLAPTPLSAPTYAAGPVFGASAATGPTYAAAAPEVEANQAQALPATSRRPGPLPDDLEGGGASPAGQQQTPRTGLPPVLPFQLRTVGGQRLSSTAKAMQRANLSPAQCRRLLKSHAASFRRQGPYRGVANPLRVSGEIEGVRFRAPGGKSPYGVLDCRMALTLIDFAAFLRERGIVEVVIDNLYRPNARLPSSRSKRSQHAYGLAVDVTAFEHSDGRVFDVEDDWGAGVDTEPCGPNATLESPSDKTVFLRNLVCDLVDQQLFHHHLTPSYDAAHRNHLHLDIKRDAATLIIR